MASESAKVVSFPSRDVTAANTMGHRSTDSLGVTGEPNDAGGIPPRSSGAPSAVVVTQVPRIVPIQFLGREDIKLSSPIFAVIEESPNGDYTAVSHDLELGGLGHSDFEALDDLRAQIAELYDALQEMSGDLPGHLRLKLVFLESMVARVAQDR